jgi:hypothetical protein
MTVKLTYTEHHMTLSTKCGLGAWYINSITTMCLKYFKPNSSYWYGAANVRVLHMQTKGQCVVSSHALQQCQAFLANANLYTILT